MSPFLRTLYTLLTATLLLNAPVASAHFQNFLARIIHIAPADGGTLVYARLPLAALLVPADWDPGAPSPRIPFVYRAHPDDSPNQLLLDLDAVRAKRDDLRARLSRALLIDADDTVPSPKIDAIRIQPIARRGPFSVLSQIRAGFPEGFSSSPGPLTLADALVDFRAFYPGLRFDRIRQIRSSPDEWPALAAREINILTVHRPSGNQRLTSAGRLALPLAASAGPPASLLGQIRHGIHHVLTGLDHVLFMLTLMLAARHWRGFLRTSLAFTLGHSITLAIGALGWVPTAVWFAPLVETGIALSILYGGAMLVLGRGDRLLAGRVFAIGLLHGLGFAFVLQQASGEAPATLLRLWAGFNLGIECGQLSIYLAAAPVLWLLSRYWPLQRFAPQPVLALPCMLVALVWVLERGIVLGEALIPA